MKELDRRVGPAIASLCSLLLLPWLLFSIGLTMLKAKANRPAASPPAGTVKRKRPRAEDDDDGFEGNIFDGIKKRKKPPPPLRRWLAKQWRSREEKGGEGCWSRWTAASLWPKARRSQSRRRRSPPKRRPTPQRTDHRSPGGLPACPLPQMPTIKPLKCPGCLDEPMWG